MTNDVPCVGNLIGKMQSLLLFPEVIICISRYIIQYKYMYSKQNFTIYRLDLPVYMLNHTTVLVCMLPCEQNSLNCKSSLHKRSKS